MKKNLLVFLLINSLFLLSAQKVEVFCSIPFCEDIPYFENDDVEGPYAGITDFFIDEEKNCYLFIRKSNSWIRIEHETQKQRVMLSCEAETGIPYWTYTGNDYFYGMYDYGQSGDDFCFFRTSDNSTKRYSGKSEFYLDDNASKQVGNSLFLSDKNNKLLMFDFNPSAKVVFRNTEETEKYLSEELKKQYGMIIEKRNAAENSPIIIGNSKLSGLSGIYFFYGLSDSVIKGIGASKKDILDLGYDFLGCDGNGLFYFIKFESEAKNADSRRAALTGKEIRYSIAVEDIWTKRILIYDFDKGLWNPPRIKGHGSFNGTYPWFVSSDGDVYYADGDVAKGEYQIKKISNVWYEDFEIYSRNNGKINDNGIPLLQNVYDKSSTEDLVYQNDLVWQTQKNNNWSKVRTLTGKEGWVETKCIDFKTVNEEDSPSLIGKVLSCSDNLRLRAEDSFSSSVVVSMLKGTKVKVLKVGHEETIDGIKNNWVQVEVLDGAKDKDGKAIKAGTKGWCFAGYLE